MKCIDKGLDFVILIVVRLIEIMLKKIVVLVWIVWEDGGIDGFGGKGIGGVYLVKVIENMVSLFDRG